MVLLASQARSRVSKLVADRSISSSAQQNAASFLISVIRGSHERSFPASFLADIRCRCAVVKQRKHGVKVTDFKGIPNDAVHSLFKNEPLIFEPVCGIAAFLPSISNDSFAYTFSILFVFRESHQSSPTWSCRRRRWHRYACSIPFQSWRSTDVAAFFRAIGLDGQINDVNWGQGGSSRRRLHELYVIIWSQGGGDPCICRTGANFIRKTTQQVFF